MIGSQEAQQAALEFIRRIDRNADSSKLIFIDRLTRDTSFGWVFFWDDKRYIEGGDPLCALAGNIPLAVLRDTGQVLFLPNVSPWRKLDETIANFAATLNKKCPSKRDTQANGTGGTGAIK